jgi:hypothetical protein
MSKFVDLAFVLEILLGVISVIIIVELSYNLFDRYKLNKKKKKFKTDTWKKNN